MTEPDLTCVMDALARNSQLCVFLRDGRIDALPAKRSRRLLLLDEIAQVFEPGVRYPEREVNRVLGAMFSDYATLRRCLVDENFMARAEGEYWRSGGQVPPSSPPS
ncbi:MAG TPA: DUF2087 domain-containing protein [Streptosporangiaceae bacterium]|nr:DUF2087 domain-containing protein [Streptosporangiaceae bacterium]